MSDAFRALRRRPLSVLLRLFVYLSIAFTLAVLVLVVGYILVNGLPHLSWELVFGPYSSSNPSMRFSIVTTLLLIALSLLAAVPVGVCAAIYLTEYAPKGSRVVKAVRLATETLAGIPSILYGLFGALFFGTALGLGYSVLAGALTAAIMILPVIIRTTEEAILAVPDSYREGSFGLGASRLRTIFRIVLPAAMSGIVSAVILCVGRVTSETAALIFTLGTVAKMPTSLLDSSRTLAVHMYINTRDGGMEGRNVAFATGCVLILVVICVNLAAGWLAKKTGGNKHEA